MLLFVQRRDGKESRDRVLAIVQAEPGIHISELGRRLGLPWGTTRYHLAILQRRGAVEVEKGGRERRAFPSGIPPMQRAWLAALRGPNAVDVLRLLLDDPRQSVPRLSRRLGSSEKVVRRQIANLAQAGLLHRYGQVRALYELEPDAVPQVERWLRKDGAPSLQAPEHDPMEGPGFR